MLDKKQRENLDGMIESNPIVKERIRLQRIAAKMKRTHKEWAEDRDVHGSLGHYCRRCGVEDFQVGPLAIDVRESFKTCDELLEEQKKRHQDY